MKSKPPPKEEVSKWDKRRKETIKLVEDEYFGIYLVEPHGLLIYQGDKTAIVKSVKFTSHVDEALYLISGSFCYGIIRLSEPEEIDEKTFNARFSEHCITQEELESWWPGKWPLYLYEFKWVERYPEPIFCRIPKGIQTFLTPESIEFFEMTVL